MACWKNIIYIFVASIILSSQTLVGQLSNQRKFNYFEAFGGIGSTHYFGDIGGSTRKSKLFKRFEDFDIYETRFAIHAGLRYQINKHFAASVNLIPGLIAGDDKYSINRNRGYEFHSLIVDGAAQIEYYFLPWTTKTRPYVFAGLDATAWISNNIYQAEADRQIKMRNTWGKHVGFGFRKELNSLNSYGLNVGLHSSASDFIDGYNGTTDINDMYYYVLFEYSSRIAKRSIYNRKGKLRKDGLLRKNTKKYSEENIKRIMASDPNVLTNRDRRAIKRYLKKIERRRKRGSKK